MQKDVRKADQRQEELMNALEALSGDSRYEQAYEK